MTWQPMETAPKDGTIISVRPDYGDGPIDWSGRAYWSRRNQEWTAPDPDEDQPGFSVSCAGLWKPLRGQQIAIIDG